MNDRIILYDGICNFCDSTVLFIIKKDKYKIFRYAGLQSNFAQKILEEKQLDALNIDSIVYIKQSKIYLKSAAILNILKDLGFPWSLLFVFIVFPSFVRDKVYDFIARNRYKWFGVKAFCEIPSPEIRKLFLDN